MARNYWMVKQEPSAYSWEAFVKDGGSPWTGVRNYQARIHLRAMKKGDWVLFYHSVVGKEIVGVARVAREFYPDPTAEEGDWSAVDLVPAKALRQRVGLETIKGESRLRDLPLLKQSRLSVMPLTKDQFDRIMELGQTRMV